MCGRFAQTNIIKATSDIVKTVIGKVEGYISHKPKGLKGFGYDPIFIANKKKITFGQMKPSEKYKIDHRYKAYKKIKKLF